MGPSLVPAVAAFRQTLENIGKQVCVSVWVLNLRPDSLQQALLPREKQSFTSLLLSLWFSLGWDPTPSRAAVALAEPPPSMLLLQRTERNRGKPRIPAGKHTEKSLGNGRTCPPAHSVETRHTMGAEKGHTSRGNSPAENAWDGTQGLP